MCNMMGAGCARQGTCQVLQATAGVRHPTLSVVFQFICGPHTCPQPHLLLAKGALMAPSPPVICNGAEHGCCRALSAWYTKREDWAALTEKIMRQV